MRPRGRLRVAAALALALVTLAACGVDGVTPDCSVPSVCAPNQGDASTAEDARVLADGGPRDAATDGG